MNQTMMEELVNGLIELYENRLVSIILYGSVARGTNTEDSDIDIAVILKGYNDSYTKDKLIDMVVDMDLKYDKVFSIIDIDYNKFVKWENTLPFYRNVKEEGVVLWKVA
ncbi:MAG: nucleotidyltransferase domain-containing protein [Velocimicrobium sp.]